MMPRKDLTRRFRSLVRRIMVVVQRDCWVGGLCSRTLASWVEPIGYS